MRWTSVYFFQFLHLTLSYKNNEIDNKYINFNDNKNDVNKVGSPRKPIIDINSGGDEHNITASIIINDNK